MLVPCEHLGVVLGADRFEPFRARIGIAGVSPVKMGADVILPMGITQCPVRIKPDFLTHERAARLALRARAKALGGKHAQSRADHGAKQA
jgi:hypothetical protein